MSYDTWNFTIDITVAMDTSCHGNKSALSSLPITCFPKNLSHNASAIRALILLRIELTNCGNMDAYDRITISHTWRRFKF
ncbi:hypothetical protein DPX16_14190 [Anabarilius grahami]|uniref:Uncharacterized protein n=1 Tax=Anabarilius grahami TaxID=495550 RepID=A0A3N0XF76_ANAGA|nr:hypothetical protein DPX16_14190 [Anabarilius grahami]